MKPFKLHDPVIWQDEKTNDITGTITEVSDEGFRIDWYSPSPYDDGTKRGSKYRYYRWDYLNITTKSGKSVIRLDISRIREEKIDNILK